MKGIPVNIGTNTGQVIIGGTVIYNGNGSSADAHEPTNSCPIDTSPQRGSGDTLAVELFVRPYVGSQCWDRKAIIGYTPSTVQFEILYVNTSNVIQKDVVIGVSLPPGLHLLPGTTYLANSNYPSGTKLKTDAIASSGIMIGSYGAGVNAYLAFEVQTPALDDLKCGPNALRAIATVQPKGLEYFWNRAEIDLTRAC